MLNIALHVLSFLLLTHQVSNAGSPCPPVDEIHPCFCSIMDAKTVLICSGIQNKTQLAQVTKSFKSMIVDRLLMLNTFSETKEYDDSIENFVVSDLKPKYDRIFPKKWLAELRVRELEIQGGNLENCFLCDDALEGQNDFLTGLVAKNANLSGHLCSTCGLGSPANSMSTRELKKTPLIEYVDLSHNSLEVLDGLAFPSTLRELKKIVISNNHLSRINDNAFGNLHKLAELDLSRNQLSSISRKMFRNDDISLKVLDFSYNSIQSVPEDMFYQIKSLSEVKFSNNLLSTLSERTWRQLPILAKEVDLRGNFLVCNCSMEWVNNFSKSTKMLAQCLLPKEVEFQDLKPRLASIAACPRRQ